MVEKPGDMNDMNNADVYHWIGFRETGNHGFYH